LSIELIGNKFIYLIVLKLQFPRWLALSASGTLYSNSRCI